MGHKCYISFKTEDSDYKTEIQNMGIDMIDKSLNEAIDSRGRRFTSCVKSARTTYLIQL